MDKHRAIVGEWVRHFTERVVAIANSTGQSVIAEYSGVELTVNPNDDSYSLAESFQAEIEQRHTDRQERQAALKMFGKQTGSYDVDDPDKKSVMAERVVDVSGLCPRLSDQDKAVLKYGRIVKGPFVELETWRYGKESEGTGLLLYQGLSIPGLAVSLCVTKIASSWGLSPEMLARIILYFAPKEG